MKKIMFNDKYGLTQAVLEGRKTMTRRTIRHSDSYEGREFGYYRYTPGTMAMSPNNNGQNFLVELLDADEQHYDTERYVCSGFSVAEEVAIAQSYKTLEKEIDRLGLPLNLKPEIYKMAGYKNKMFVKGDDMPHHIQITSIRVEHLQDITDEDCMKEGVLSSDKYAMPYGIPYNNGGVFFYYSSPREAFSALIDKVSGKGTWESNPLVWVYEFKLID